MIPFKTFQNLSKDKQERITRIAVEEFSEKGYAQASINSIVSRLGIAKGSIFQYFGNKKGLFIFAFNISMNMVKDYLRTVRDQTRSENLFTRLEATLLAGVIFLQKHPVIYRLYIRIMFEYEIPFRNEILLSLREYSLKYFRTLLTDAAANGEIRAKLDIDKACFVLDAVMDRFLQAKILPHLDAGLGIYNTGEQEAREWIKELTDILRTGLGI
ncbi:DNA-binding HTH domain-containing protein, TetR-type [Desulfonema limicola]|uniref:DNA-binding HTH domain-containing protein, TetR-type n=1 Tax=Desulfonema limicola TaxID=45656 RepID=A0A975BDD3_9BACT|nr:TetR/AcrR family transcriptional regulator [Desulfonema limicola]QTA83452.1 DNA-binding HTH domain-containing protein, TetR-type [Desulfonema limicola]